MGSAFFFKVTMSRDWAIFYLVRSSKNEKKIPVIIDREIAWQLINSIRTIHNHTFFLLLYTCGLRSSEALRLKPKDIDAKRMVIRIVMSKGKRTREVPITPLTLLKLRQYWVTHRNPNFIFPAVGQNMKGGPTATKHMILSSTQDVLRKACHELKLTQKITPHTFRHCYATHLLDAGVNIRMVQIFLGHAHIMTTCIYLHVSKNGMTQALKVVIDIFGDKDA
jgi:integrase/recombinase XerD